MGGMLGALQTYTLGENFIHLIGAKRILDVGTSIGGSALAWSLATGEGGKALWHGLVVQDPSAFDTVTKAIDETNKKVR
ncbi:unnamed protein product [Strongylus vulgaris]|uniref:Uncharacterized protein n=1 Tax=Strongylus vulgaris TaxID=40348 RepID=A0A3P7JJ27_STRVU|nr:unnamed protein product [Strongylus vulgaris]